MAESTENKSISMDDVMNASFGEVSNKMTVTFKKTVLVRDYETEVIEATTSLDLDHTVSGIERMFITAVLEIQMEYTVFINLTTKGLVTQKQLVNRKKELEDALNAIKVKADMMLGPGVIDKYIKDIK